MGALHLWRTAALKGIAAQRRLYAWARNVHGSPNCDIMQRIDGNLELLNAKIIIDSAKDGDSHSLMLFNRYTKYLALACNTIISFLDPEMIVLGGGVSHAGDFLLKSITEKLPHYLMFKTMPYATIKLATLGNEAGIIGSALLARDMLTK